MSWCPKCRTEYRNGFSVCSNCGSQLTENLPPTEESKSADLVTVAIVYGQAEAEIVKAKLESKNIPVHLKREAIQIVYGFKLDGLGEVEVQVPQPLVKQARKVLGVL